MTGQFLLARHQVLVFICAINSMKVSEVSNFKEDGHITTD